MIDWRRKIAAAEAELKDAIENGDRKGKWFAEGKVFALKNCRLNETVDSGETIKAARMAEALNRIANMEFTDRMAAVEIARIGLAGKRAE